MPSNNRIPVLRLMLGCQLVIFAVVGCATIFSGSSSKLSFSSDVDGVRIYIDGQLVGKTPFETTLDSRMGAKGPTLRAEKEGFRTQEFPLRKRFNKTAIWNSTGLFSWGTDLLSGALFEYEPKKYHIELVPDDRAAVAPKFYRNRLIHRFVIVNYSNILEDLARGHGEYLSNLASVWIEENQDRAALLALLGNNREMLLLSESGSDLLIRINRELSPDVNMKRHIL